MNVSSAARVLKTELSSAVALCEGINTPRALAVALMIKYGEFDQLVNLQIDWRHYTDPDSFRDDYMVTSILQKNPRIPTSYDRRQKAIDKFHAAERQCAETNHRLELFGRGMVSPTNPLVSRTVHTARELLRKWLNHAPSRSQLRSAYESMGFGPGATTSLSGVVTKGKKYSLRTSEATPRVSQFRTFFMPHLWRENSQDLRIVESSKLVTVPKNAKTDRCICIEPDLNIYVQKGFGRVLRDVLASLGVNLRSQERNQFLASQAWKRNLTTMDLSAASDTISKECVWLLLPFSWADALEFSRVDSTELEGHRIHLEKWSSMGNGYTFELETLLFYSLVVASCVVVGCPIDDASCYGDDIIVPTAASGVLTATLEFLGFSVNQEKTFGTGLFHESCGKDYFMGVDVRPVFFRTETHDFETSCYINANNLQRWAGSRYDCFARDARVLPAWLRCFTAVAPTHRHRVPEGFGDVGFVSSFDEARPNLHRPRGYGRGWAGISFNYRRIGIRTVVVDTKGSYIATLAGEMSDSQSGMEALRGRHMRAATRVGTTLAWPHLGAWA
nr:MAG: RNA replicase beta chain [Sanya fiers-like virus 47]